MCQKDTRLEDARDSAKSRGLTRAEVTFYTNSIIPSDVFIDNVLHNVIRYVPKSLVYSTPYAATWKVYCATFMHRSCLQRSYTVNAAKKQITRFGTSYRLLIEDGDGNYIVWSNKYIADKFAQIVNDNLVNLDGDLFYLDGTPLGVLTITGQGVNQYNHVTVYCTFALNIVNEKAAIIEDDDCILEQVKGCDVIPLVGREELLPYREYENLI